MFRDTSNFDLLVSAFAMCQYNYRQHELVKIQAAGRTHLLRIAKSHGKAPAKGAQNGINIIKSRITIITFYPDLREFCLL
jgi:hypothetical protein